MGKVVSTIRAARRSDGDSIAGIIQFGFDASRIGLTIYGCHGIGAFISDQVSATERYGDTAYWVAEIDGSVAGCLEMRHRPGTARINYIAMAPGCRAQGLGSQLLRAGLEALHTDQQAGDVGLDVFADNRGAIRWYERLGFAAGAERVYAEIEPLVEHKGHFCVSGWPQALTLQTRYGFAELSVTTERRSHRIGLLETRGFEFARVPPWRILICGVRFGASIRSASHCSSERSPRRRGPAPYPRPNGGDASSRCSPPSTPAGKIDGRTEEGRRLQPLPPTVCVA